MIEMWFAFLHFASADEETLDEEKAHFGHNVNATMNMPSSLKAPLVSGVVLVQRNYA